MQHNHYRASPPLTIANHYCARPTSSCHHAAPATTPVSLSIKTTKHTLSHIETRLSPPLERQPGLIVRNAAEAIAPEHGFNDNQRLGGWW
ncbi:hypothetical protein HanIR_Chr11g0542231 [Helianthus annuus]|nr:hypothetical protein HanIR_Chr11g0542231 [Helianthus annuus]